MNIKKFQHQELVIDHFTTTPDQSWCVFGENHSGIDRFIDLLSGKLTHYHAECLDLPQNPGILSFRAQQDLFESEIRNDDMLPPTAQPWPGSRFKTSASG